MTNGSTVGDAAHGVPVKWKKIMARAIHESPEMRGKGGGNFLRNVVSYPVQGKNSLQYWTQAVHPFKAAWNFMIIQICRYSPSLKLKNLLYRSLGIKVGRHVSFGLMAMVDIFFPQLITIGDNSILGYNCTLLCHEFLIREYRTGPVVIGKDVMIGANATILPGISIGDGAVVGAGAVVTEDVAPYTTVFGVPAKPKDISI